VETGKSGGVPDVALRYKAEKPAENQLTAGQAGK
jgi:hypothetical protein